MLSLERIKNKIQKKKYKLKYLKNKLQTSEDSNHHALIGAEFRLSASQIGVLIIIVFLNCAADVS